jgi:kynurenine formamidase
MRTLVAATLTVSLIGCPAAGKPSAFKPPEHIVDLTHTLSPRFPYIPIRDLTFPIRIIQIGDFDKDGVYSNRWELTEHNGTHIDAPNHFVKNARGLDELAATELIVPAAVIDFRAQTKANPDAQLTVADVQAWERAHGRLPERAAVLLWSGWESRAGSQAAFINADNKRTMHFPGFSEAVVAFLVKERNVIGIGTDTLSIDNGPDLHFTAHRTLFAADKWALECLAHLGDVPPVGATLIVGATKVEHASGGPARVLAIW